MSKNLRRNDIEDPNVPHPHVVQDRFQAVDKLGALLTREVVRGTELCKNCIVCGVS